MKRELSQRLEALARKSEFVPVLCEAPAHRGRLCRLVMGKPEHRDSRAVYRRTPESQDAACDLEIHQTACIEQRQQIRITDDILARHPQVNNRPRLRARVAEGVDMGHDIVSEVAFVGLGGEHLLVGDAAGPVHHRPQLLDLLRAHRQPQLVLRLGDRQPDPPPDVELVARRPETEHLRAGVAGGEGGGVGVVEVGHGRLYSQNRARSASEGPTPIHHRRSRSRQV